MTISSYKGFKHLQYAAKDLVTLFKHDDARLDEILK
jgi:hypothetical protein